MVAVNVLNASCETQHTGFKDDTDRIAYLKEKLSASDLVLEEPNRRPDSSFRSRLVVTKLGTPGRSYTHSSIRAEAP